jgi:hypothetical protein
VTAHRRCIGGSGKAPGKQDGSIDHLGEGRGGRQTEAARGEVDDDGGAPLVNGGKGPAHEHQ